MGVTYRIREELARTDTYRLVRADRVVDASTVVLKEALAPAKTGAAALRREHELFRSLDVPGLARPVALDEERKSIVFADSGGVSLETSVERSRASADVFLAMAQCLAATVESLHGRDIVIGNLHPRGFLVGEGSNRPVLLDLSGATTLRREVETPALVPGAESLAYVAPEQTGRMNRVVDYRADLYSLGALFYFLLIGRPPFSCSDPLEQVHCLIAKTPRSAHEVDPGIPRAFSAIIAKLLATSADDRYQSATGVLDDLAVCTRLRSAGGSIPEFPVGTHDVADRFTIPQHLYGRAGELEALLGAFDGVCGGAATLLLVKGYSGVGKTALVNEVHRPITQRRGRFLSGKFDQLARNVPYGALSHAFRALFLQILAEPEERAGFFRDSLREALGANAGVISAVIPELDLVLGPPPAVTMLEPAQAENRFWFVFQSFLAVFARAEHPLVLFLDDIQWADPATLQLLAHLLPNPGVKNLLVIGAYRDNEVGPGHPMLKMVGDVRALGARVQEVAVPPLRLAHVNEFVADALRQDRGSAEGLSRLVYEKTGGNPFFLIQFLKSLHASGLLWLNHAQRSFEFDLTRIERAQMTDNVVELMTGRLEKLPPTTQRLVALAACVGGTFSLPTLAVIGERSHLQAAGDLWGAIQEGLVLPLSDGYEDLLGSSDEEWAVAKPVYRFLHDRVQQAAYGLIPPAQRKAVHLSVGRLLRDESGDEVGNDERLFDIVNHLNVGRDGIEGDEERLDLVRLNLAAGRRAKASAAFPEALDYFSSGLALLPGDRWSSQYDLTAALTLQIAECDYLCGSFEQADRGLDTLLREAHTPLERAEAYRMRIMQYDSLARYKDAVDAGREGLAMCGVALPTEPTEAARALEAELSRIEAALGDRTIASLEELPEMHDAEGQMVIALSTAMWASAYILGDRVLASLLSARMVSLSMERGNTADSAYGYVTHAIAVGPVRQDYRAAYEWGALALQVNERLNDLKGRARVHQQFNAHVNLWRRPLATCIPHAREACRSGLDTGDFTYAGYGAFTETWAALLTSRDLEHLVHDFTPTTALLRRIRRDSLADGQELFLAWARALQGRTARSLSLSSAGFDEGEYLARHAANGFNLTFYYAAKLHLGVIFGEFGAALEAARTAREQAWRGEGTLWPIFNDFWTGLALSATYDAATDEERRSSWAELAQTRERMQILADNCPENFRCFALMLGGEMERLRGQTGAAARAFDEAIAYARQTSSLQNEALASELGGRLWSGAGPDHTAVAGAHFRDARRAYAAWGAAAKAAQITVRYGHELDAARAIGVSRMSEPSRIVHTMAALDLSTVIKAAHTLSGRIELEALLRDLIKIAIENAGADHGLLFLERDDRLWLEAEALVDPERVKVRQSISEDEATGFSKAVVRYVRRVGESVVLGDARNDDRFAEDPYVRESKALSILCVPVVHQGRQRGILYLENHLATDAFTSERVEMMQVLAAQAAISLENARLYEGMREEVERRGAAERALREALTELETLKDRLQAENVYLQDEIRTQHNFEEIVGNSAALLDALKKVERVAPTDATALLIGETGTGKELFAHAIHSRSRRAARTLVKVNCGAIAPGLVESELFGHVRGAFTGALQNRVGRFELAHGGTLFLDEVSELPLATQVKLLRVLQEQEFEPVGSSRSVKVDVRVIAATNRNLDEAVRAGRFRADLVYRLNVFPINVPPLRDRPEDIPLLVALFTARLSKKLGKPIDGVSRRGMERLLAYRWPGNVRELQNVIERAAILALGPVLDLEDSLLPSLERAPQRAESLEALERDHIATVLGKTGGVIEGRRGAAALLGLHPNTLRSRMKKLGIDRPRNVVSAHEIRGERETQG